MNAASSSNYCVSDVQRIVDVKQELDKASNFLPKEYKCVYNKGVIFKLHFYVTKKSLSIYLSGLVTAVAVFRNPNTIPFCLTTEPKSLKLGTNINRL